MTNFVITDHLRVRRDPACQRIYIYGPGANRDDLFSQQKEITELSVASFY